MILFTLLFINLSITLGMEVFLRNNRMACSSNKCYGTKESPYGSLYEAFSVLQNMKFDNDHSIDFILEPNEKEVPYLLLEEDLKKLDVFSPFMYLLDDFRIRICSQSCSENLVYPAFISLRSEKLVFEIKMELTIKNIIFDGSNFPALDKNISCVNENSGCCFEEYLYKDPSSPCYLRRRTILFSPPSSVYTPFSFFTDQSKEGDDPKKLKVLNLINVIFFHFFSVKNYVALVSVGHIQTSQINLQNCLVNNIFIFESLLKIIGNISANSAVSISSSTILEYKNYMTYILLNNLGNHFCLVEKLSLSALPQFMIKDFEFLGTLLSVVESFGIKIPLITAKRVNANFLQIMNSSFIDIQNLQAEEIDVKGIWDHLGFIFLNNCSNISVKASQFTGIRLNLINTFIRIFSSQNIILVGNVFEKLIVSNVGIISMSDVVNIAFVGNLVSQILVKFNGLFMTSRFISNFLCENTYFMDISGRTGVLISVSVDDKPSDITVSNCTFLRLASSSGYFIFLMVSESTILIIKNSNFYYLMDAREVFSITSPKLVQKEFLIQINILGISIMGCSSTIFFMASEKVKVILNYVQLSRIYTYGNILFLTHLTSEFELNNAKISDCASPSGLGESTLSTQIRYLRFNNLKIINIVGSGRIYVHNFTITLMNCIYSLVEGYNGIHFFDVFDTNIYVSHSILENFHMTDVGGFHLINYDSLVKNFHFTSCIIRNFASKNIGGFLVCHKNANFTLINCTFSNITGDVFTLIIGFSFVSVVISNSLFYKIQTFLKGGISVIGVNSYCLINNSHFRKISSVFDGPISIIQHGSVKVESSVFKQISGNRGGAFYIYSIGSLELNHSAFIGCQANHYGGIVATIDFTYISINDCLFLNIISSSSGGAFHFYSKSSIPSQILIIRDCFFIKVYAQSDGGIMYVNNANGISLLNNTFNISKAENGGVLYFRNTKGLLITGFISTDSFTVEKGGIFYFENCTKTQLNNIMTSHFVSLNNALFAFITNSFIEIKNISISNVSTDSNAPLFMIYNQIKTEITIFRMRVSSIENDVIIFRANNEKIATDLHISLTDCLVSNSSLKGFLQSFFSSSFLSNIGLNKINCKKCLGGNIFQILNGSLIVSSTFLNESIFETFLASNFSSSISVSDLIIYESVLSTYLFVMKSIFTFEIKKIKVLLKNFNDAILLSINIVKNFTMTEANISGHEKLFNSSHAIKLITSKGSNLYITKITLNKLFTSAELFFDINLSNNTFKLDQLSVFTTLSKLLIFSIRFSRFSLVSLSNLNFGNEVGRNSILSFEFRETEKPLGVPLETIRISDITCISESVSFSFFKLERYIEILNINIIGNPSLIVYKPAFYFLNCLSTFLSTIQIKNITGTNAISFYNDLNRTSTLNIIDGNFFKIMNFEFGGALNIWGRIALTLKNLLVNGCSAKKGGGVYIRNDKKIDVLDLSGLIITGNSADLGYLGLGLILAKPLTLTEFEKLRKTNTIEGNKLKNTINTNYSQIGVQVARFSLRIEIANKTNITLSSTYNTTYNYTAQLMIEPYSGEAINLTLEFFDELGRPSFDFVDSVLICDEKRNYNRKFSVIFEKQIAKIESNIVALKNFQIINPEPSTEGTFSCSIIQKGPSLSDLLLSSFQTVPIKFRLTPCKVGQIIRENKCVTCPSGYSFEKNITLDTHCQTCPSNARCVSGNQILALPGYWNADGNSKNIYKCMVESSCLGSPLNCDDGYTGAICYFCDTGYGKLYTGVCKTCSDPWAISYSIIHIVVIFSVLFSLAYLSSFWEYDEKYLDLKFMFRVLIEFFELFTIIFSWIRDIPLSFRPFYAILSIFSFYGGYEYIFDCISSFIDTPNRYLVKSVGPFFLIAIFSLFILIPILIINQKRKKGSKMKKSPISLTIKILCLTFYLLSTNFLRAFYSSFACFYFHSSDPNYYLLFDYPNINCFSDFHLYRIIPSSSALFIVFLSISLLWIKMRSFDQTEAKTFDYINHGFGRFEVVWLGNKGLEIISAAIRYIIVLSSVRSRLNPFDFQLATHTLLIIIFGFNLVRGGGGIWGEKNVLKVNLSGIYLSSIFYIYQIGDSNGTFLPFLVLGIILIFDIFLTFRAYLIAKKLKNRVE